MTVSATYNYGRWIADCPNPECTNAVGLKPGQTSFKCVAPNGLGACGTTADIVWPDDPATIVADLAGTPEQHQNWTPEGAL